MAVRQPRYSKEEFARRGTDLCDRQIRSEVEEGNKGKIVAIDIETGEYSVGENILSASQPLFDRNAASQLWAVRVGYAAVHHIGGRAKVVTEKLRIGNPRLRSAHCPGDRRVVCKAPTFYS